MNNNKDEIEIDLRELFLLIRKKLLLILAVTITCGVAAGLVSYYLVTPKYQSTSKIYILTDSGSVVSLTDLQVGSSLANDYSELIQSRPVVEGVIENLELDMTYDDMLDLLTIENPENTRMIKMTVTYKDPNVAKEIANEFANVTKSQIPRIMKTDEPSIVEEAIADADPVSPNVKKNAVIAAVIGMFVSIGAVVVMNLLDDTVKTTEDVERYLKLNTLAAIPQEGGTDNTEKKTKHKRHKSGRK